MSWGSRPCSKSRNIRCQVPASYIKHSGNVASTCERSHSIACSGQAISQESFAYIVLLNHRGSRQAPHITTAKRSLRYFWWVLSELPLPPC